MDYAQIKWGFFGRVNRQAQYTTLPLPFLSLFDRVESKSEIVALFMAVLSLVKDGYVLLEKRLSVLTPEDEAELWDNVDDYRYEFFCALNPEQAVPEDYAGLYDETPVSDGDTDEHNDSIKGDTVS